MNRQTANNWRPFLNVMQRLDMEIEIARTCQREPRTAYVGRKENYELKRDWASHLDRTAADGTYKVRGLTVVLVDKTEGLEVV